MGRGSISIRVSLLFRYHDRPPAASRQSRRPSGRGAATHNGSPIGNAIHWHWEMQSWLARHIGGSPIDKPTFDAEGS
jgi:hypothetical protein